MALNGTLKDFGIADILQLIGQQQKTGTLVLRAKDQEVRVGFKEGNIVRAESTTRKKKDLIGNMLVRAELISERQLEEALQTQKRTLRRLGDLLVSSGAISAARFKEMVRLQTTETLFALFHWKSGSYAFEQGEVEYDADVMAPLRAEAVLMEGFRMVDEWPMIKKRITSYQLAFEKSKALPSRSGSVESSDGGLGDAERRVFELVAPERTVRKLIDLSCLGEFETCKALSSLVNLDYLKPVPAKAGEGDEGEGGALFLERAGGVTVRILGAMLVLGALAFVAVRADIGSVNLSRAPAATYSDPAAQRFVARQQVARIRAALDVYRIEHGEVPDRLDALVEAGLLAREDLHYPWRDTYFYRRQDARQFVLLPPLR
ncbi:MAG: DUF4388 domain-containing protein [Myxococcales bacterium]|nr:DUF4388 domain-containing protein [Myxococcales bacterium]